MNGGGYPEGITDKQVTLGARIICKVCSGKFGLEKDDDCFCASFTGEHATQTKMRTEPDFDPINEILTKVPDGLRF